MTGNYEHSIFRFLGDSDGDKDGTFFIVIVTAPFLKTAVSDLEHCLFKKMFILHILSVIAEQKGKAYIS